MNTQSVKLSSPSISKKVLATRAARRNRETSSRSASILASSFLPKEVEYETDSHNRKVRLGSATAAEIKYFLTGCRIVGAVDILEAIGESGWTNLMKSGCLVRAKWMRGYRNNMYWVTKKVAELYGLPTSITLAGGATVALVDPE